MDLEQIAEQYTEQVADNQIQNFEQLGEKDSSGMLVSGVQLRNIQNNSMERIREVQDSTESGLIVIESHFESQNPEPLQQEQDNSTFTILTNPIYMLLVSAITMSYFEISGIQFWITDYYIFVLG